MVADICRVDKIYYNLYGRYYGTKSDQSSGTTVEEEPLLRRTNENGWFRMAVLPKGFRVPGEYVYCRRTPAPRYI